MATDKDNKMWRYLEFKFKHILQALEPYKIQYLLKIIILLWKNTILQTHLITPFQQELQQELMPLN